MKQILIPFDEYELELLQHAGRNTIKNIDEYLGLINDFIDTGIDTSGAYECTYAHDYLVKIFTKIKQLKEQNRKITSEKLSTD